MTVVSKAESEKNKTATKAKWVCLCDCGKMITMRTDSLKRNKMPSCGCAALEAHKIKSSKIGTAYRSALAEYKAGARRRGLQWTITDPFAMQLLIGNCYYCGSALPRTVCSVAGEIFRCTGIDRLDNTHGYVQHNVVSCCSVCNIAKSDKSVNEFKDWIVRVYAEWASK